MMSILINPAILAQVVNKARYNQITYQLDLSKPVSKQTFVKKYEELCFNMLGTETYNFETYLIFIESYPGLKDIAKGMLGVFKKAIALIKEEKKKNDKEEKKKQKLMDYWRDHLRFAYYEQIRGMIDTTERNYYMCIFHMGYWKDIAKVKCPSKEADEHLEKMGFKVKYERYCDYDR